MMWEKRGSYSSRVVREDPSGEVTSELRPEGKGSAT